MKISTFTKFGAVLLGAFVSLPLMADQFINADVPIGIVVPTGICGNQSIAFGGTAHAFVNVTTNKNSLHIRLHLNVQDVSGISLIDGTKYNLVGAQDTEINASGMPPVEAQTNMDFGFIGQGPAPNSRLRFVIHTTVSANGGVSAEVVKAYVMCE